jgi:hypothetical protein
MARRRLPPDPDGMNAMRAAAAEKSLLLFVVNTGADWSDAMADLLCNLMHLADHDDELDFAQDLERARDHYAAETGQTEDL